MKSNTIKILVPPAIKRFLSESYLRKVKLSNPFSYLNISSDEIGL